jgi:predicted AAA+ superfamily ATPase
MFSREKALNKLLILRGTSPIKVITGIRRCGKSTLMELFKEHLAAQGADVVHINKVYRNKIAAALFFRIPLVP